MNRKKFQKGDFIVNSEEVSSSAYIVEAGEVRVEYADGNVEPVNFRPGEMFGELGLIKDLDYKITATALENSVLLVVSQQDIEDKTATCDPLVNLFLKIFMERSRLPFAQLGDGPAHRPIATYLGIDSHDQIKQSQNHLLELYQAKGELQLAIERNEFILHYQPVISLRGGHTSGFEALVRWQHPTRGLLSPFHFIEIAEQTDMIIPLGNWVFEEASRQLAIFNRHLKTIDQQPAFMCINISAVQFADPFVLQNFTDLMNRNENDPAQIHLEITESVLMEDGDRTVQILNGVKELGVELVLDDFGTGYSSLSYLHRFPIDTLKIDRSFTSGLLRDKDSMEIVRAISGLAKNLNIKVVAEGIEQLEELSIYRDMGSDYGQGFLMSRPLPAEEIIPLLGKRISW